MDSRDILSYLLFVLFLFLKVIPIFPNVQELRLLLGGYKSVKYYLMLNLDLLHLFVDKAAKNTTFAKISTVWR